MLTQSLFSVSCFLGKPKWRSMISFTSILRLFISGYLDTLDRAWNFLLAFLQIYSVKSVQIRSFFWSVFSNIRTEYEDLRSKSPYSLRIQENTDHNKLRIWALFTQWFRSHSSQNIVYHQYKHLEVWLW